MATLTVYGPDPGLVARCPGCTDVMLRLVRTEDAVWLDLAGTAAVTLVGLLFVVTGASCATGRRVVTSLTANCHEVEAGVHRKPGSRTRRPQVAPLG